jgi:DNA repair protein RecO (recombination protein O)
MLKKCRGIVLSTVNYSENSVVLKCYTDAFGLQTYMINGVKGKKGGIRPSQLMPLSILELEVYHQQNKNLQRIKELKCVPQLHHLHFVMAKSSVALFMAELLNRSLREESELDENLFEFLFHSIQIVDLTEENLSHFPVFFMLQLSKYLGFFPKDNYSETLTDFSLMEGLFMANSPNTPDYCKGAYGFGLNQFIHTDFDSFHTLKIPADVRKVLLDKMVRYFQLHLMLFGELKSPRVLHEVLS